MFRPQSLVTVLLWMMAASLGGVTVSPAAAQEEPAYIVLIDVSGSMDKVPSGWSRPKLEEVKHQLTEFLANLPNGTEIFVYTFSNRAPDPDAPLVHATMPEGREQLRTRFEQLRASGNTHAWDSLRVVLGKARTLIAQAPTRQVRLFVFTDGEDSKYRGAASTRELDRVLSEYSDLLKDRSPLRYVKMSFTLGEDLKSVFDRHNVPVIDVLEPEVLIPTVPDFGWSPERPTTESLVQFFDRSIGLIQNYEWSLGDGTTSDQKTPAKRYETAGAYEVVLRVQGLNGEWVATAPKTIRVAGREPLVVNGRTIPESPAVGQPVVFVNESTGGATAFIWDFGDGATATEENPTHSFANAGEYPVVLEVRGGDEVKRAEVARVRVRPPEPPAASFQHQARGYPGELLWFVDTSTGLIDEYAWDFGDGTEVQPGRRIDHSFAETGTFDVVVTVRGPGGDHTARGKVEIAPYPAPTAKVEVGTTKPRRGEPVRLFDRSTGSIDRVVWDFGDGTPPMAVEYGTGVEDDQYFVEHEFADFGRYTVRLSVTGPGGEDSAETVVDIPRPTKPEASFVIGVQRGYVGDEIRFTDQSDWQEGRVATAVWDFGDGSDELRVSYDVGSEESVRTVGHVYQRANIYTVTLRVEGPGGDDSTTRSLEIVDPVQPPKASLSVDTRRGRSPLTVRFRNESSGSVSKFVLDFGDGTSLEEPADSASTSVTHEYSSPGEYHPRLTAYADGQAPSSAELAEGPIVVVAPPSWFARHWWHVGLAVVGVLLLAWLVKALWPTPPIPLRGTLRYWADDVSGAETRELYLGDEPGAARGTVETSVAHPDGRSFAAVIQRLDPEDGRERCNISLRSGDGLLDDSVVAVESEQVRCGPFIFDYQVFG